MTETDWIRDVPEDDLAEIHHACRMFTKYPGLPDDQLAKTTRLADLAWDELGRRFDRERKQALARPASRQDNP